jgi:thioredoxin-related protein
VTARRIALLILVLALAAGCGGETGNKAGAARNTWLSFEDGMELARNLGKPVVIDFYTSWCRWCRVMDKETFRNESVASYLNEHFISIKLNAEQKSGSLEYGGRTYTPEGLARAFRVRGYPSIAYLDAEGKLLFVDAGFKKPEQFMVNLKYVTSECYKKGMKIEEFRKRGGDCS